MKVLNEHGDIVELPKGEYRPVGHVTPGEKVKPSEHNRLQRGFWGQGYYDAYWWNAELQAAFFNVGCPHSATHMEPDIGKAALRIERAIRELDEASRALKVIQEVQILQPAVQACELPA